MHLWKYITCCGGISSLYSLNIGRQYTESSMLGIGFGKLGISEKSKGEYRLVILATHELVIPLGWTPIEM